MLFAFKFILTDNKGYNTLLFQGSCNKYHSWKLNCKIFKVAKQWCCDVQSNKLSLFSMPTVSSRPLYLMFQELISPDISFYITLWHNSCEARLKLVCTVYLSIQHSCISIFSVFVCTSLFGSKQTRMGLMKFSVSEVEKQVHITFLFIINNRFSLFYTFWFLDL